MAYHNRKELLYRTLKSITNTKYKNFEVIIIDDCSNFENQIWGFKDEFKFLRVIRLEPENKWYVNPCIPFNVGIKEASGEIIVLQNPECLHVHDIISYLAKTVNDSNYITISTYALNEKTTKELPTKINNKFIEYFNSLPQQPTGGSPIIGWYNHSKYRPVYYHFCSALKKKNMELLGGFDERYAHGISYDDNEFIVRIDRLGLNKIISDDVSVIHQWHPTFFYNRLDFKELHNKNNKLFYEITMNENRIKVND